MSFASTLVISWLSVALCLQASSYTGKWDSRALRILMKFHGQLDENQGHMERKEMIRQECECNRDELLY
jgi:hypothetical protein